MSRVIYSVGYYSGMPKNRIAGSLVSLEFLRNNDLTMIMFQMSLISEMALLIMTFLQVGSFAGWWTIVQAF